jgi:hypothetical protein
MLHILKLSSLMISQRLHLTQFLCNEFLLAARFQKSKEYRPRHLVLIERQYCH